MISSSILLLLVTVFTGANQVLLKIGANHGSSQNIIAAYVNPYTFGAYALYLIVTILTVFALQDIQLKLFYAVSSLKFVLILLLSKLILDESLNREKIVSVVLIVCGILIFNL